MTHDETTLQAAIDAAFLTNGDKHNGNLMTDKGHPAWSREDSARLAVAKAFLAFLAALPPAEQSAEIEKLKAELAVLKQWKSEQLQVESEWNPQMLANKLGVGLGQSCRAGIQKAVLALLEQPSLSRLRPIAEAGPVPEGCVRTFAWLAMSNAWCYTASQESWITHFADIIPPTSEAEQKSDLNACAEFEYELKKLGVFSAYLSNLALTCGFNAQGDEAWFKLNAGLEAVCSATARQRCIAYLKTKRILP